MSDAWGGRFINWGVSWGAKASIGAGSGASGPYKEPDTYDGRKKGEPWKAPQWAVEERERRQREEVDAASAAIRERLIREGKLKPQGAKESSLEFRPARVPVQAPILEPIPSLTVPQITDDDDAIIALLLTD